MNTHELYKHNLCTDTAILPVSIHYHIDGFKIKIWWFNIASVNNIYNMNLKETILIKHKDLKNWIKYE